MTVYDIYLWQYNYYEYYKWQSDELARKKAQEPKSSILEYILILEKQVPKYTAATDTGQACTKQKNSVFLFLWTAYGKNCSLVPAKISAASVTLPWR